VAKDQERVFSRILFMFSVFSMMTAPSLHGSQAARWSQILSIFFFTLLAQNFAFD